MLMVVTFATKWKAKKKKSPERNEWKSKLTEYATMAKLTSYIHNRSTSKRNGNYVLIIYLIIRVKQTGQTVGRKKSQAIYL